MSAHSVPLHCPYCAGENLHPHGDRHGAWECRECLRAFTVGFVGLLAPGPVTQRVEAETSATGGLQ
jgi:transposase-like protein